ncbi:MAG: methyl-accepting chemotaxis protein [Oscillibacter sp.]|nr:methyl-accepting chemotaxis protein [Oscillibacter sp.]MCI8690927.1 methyl-accepting chemotaxis protein [Oscillibacter sp.]MCI8847711.1 methyl-accepting chemotaxis protein [Oscillibacter sp.]MCI9481229.1 methyl-accepting chemotaxis protein [Oscillibacter sp.]
MKKAINQSTLTTILNVGSIVALLFMLLLLIAYSSVSSRLDTANENRFELTYNANRFMNGSAYLTNEVRAYAATGSQIHYDNYWNEVNNLKNRDIGVEAMQDIGITSNEQGMIDSMYALSNQLVPLEEQAMEQVQAGRQETAVNYVYGEEYSNSIVQINALKEDFLETLNNRTLHEVESLNRASLLIRILMALDLMMVGTFQVLSMRVIRKRILRPVIAVRDQMGEISQGNLSAEFRWEPDSSELGMLVASIHETKQELKKYIHDIDHTLSQMAQGNMNLTISDSYRGEFLPIQNALRQILDALNDALRHIHRTAQDVSDESERVSSGAQTLSEGAVRQASTVEELSAGIQDISGEVNHTSADADKARQFSMEAEVQLKVCSQKMDALSKAISDISESSRQINGIIRTIEDIAFQTNILALNASVEAARAGTAGKGFAVVADEVQRLASKSAESAKNITELIESSVQLVQYGTTLSDETTTALSLVVSSARQSAELVEQIAESAQQQSESLRQLTEGMESISDVVQTNAATAQESASSAAELHQQAEKLKMSIQRFQLRN